MRWVWASIGFVFLGLGAIGLILPIWPTTVFWIIAVFCLAESHPTVRDWIYARPVIGAIVCDFIEHGVIARKNKIAAIGGMLLACAISAWFLRSSAVGLAILGVLIVVAAVFVATRKEFKPET